jgi:tetratricopeptide (TPR) repeat protein
VNFRRALVIVIVLIATGSVIWWWYPRAGDEAGRKLAEAEQALADQNLERADDMLRSLLMEDSGQARAQFLYAQVARRLGRKEQAWTALARAVQLGVAAAEAKSEYALLEAADHFPVAEKVLREIAEERPTDREILKALARGYAEHGRWSDAEQFYSRCLELEPDPIPCLQDRGRVRMEQGHYRQAADDFREIVGLSPQHFEARLLLAHCLLSIARMAEAETELNACRGLRPARPEPFVGLAKCALERGQHDEAQALVKRALALDPASVMALHLHGDLYLRRQQFDLAVPVFAAVVRLQPRDKEGHLKLAQALRQQGDLQRAKAHEMQYQRLVQQEKQRTQASRLP